MNEARVYLVGAGPGDAKLLTLRGLEVLRKAEVLIYDRLVNPHYLTLVPDACELVYAGKKAHDHTLAQVEINALLLFYAQQGKTVVRLKGGDPYVFGRGGEEGAFLADNGIFFEVVPGVTSAIGGLAYAGIPITHRDHASSFHVVSAHKKSGACGLDWDLLARLEATLVILMGAKRTAEISQKLRAAGKSPKTPVALVHHATTPQQQVVVTTLEALAKTAAKSPVLIVVGDVVNLREKLNFFERRPLFGKKIMVTRAQSQSSDFVSQLMDLGAHVIEVPTIKIKPFEDQTPLEQEIEALNGYSWLVFTSVNAVNIFFDVLADVQLDARRLAHLKVAAIGKQTAKIVQSYGIRADVVSEAATLEGLAAELQNCVTAQDRLLLPKAKVARDVLKDALPAKLVEVPVYETQVDDRFKETILAQLKAGAVDYVTFSSSSTASHFSALLGKEHLALLEQVKLLSLGPITSKTIAALGLSVYKEASEPLMSALIEVILADGAEADA